jgi:hypothetical protein
LNIKTPWTPSKLKERKLGLSNPRGTWRTNPVPRFLHGQAAIYTGGHEEDEYRRLRREHNLHGSTIVFGGERFPPSHFIRRFGDRRMYKVRLPSNEGDVHRELEIKSSPGTKGGRFEEVRDAETRKKIAALHRSLMQTLVEEHGNGDNQPAQRKELVRAIRANPKHLRESTDRPYQPSLGI